MDVIFLISLLYEFGIIVSIIRTANSISLQPFVTQKEKHDHKTIYTKKKLKFVLYVF